MPNNDWLFVIGDEMGGYADYIHVVNDRVVEIESTIPLRLPGEACGCVRTHRTAGVGDRGVYTLTLCEKHSQEPGIADYCLDRGD